MPSGRIYIVGSGGHGRVILDVLRSTGVDAQAVRFVDDRPALWGTDVDGARVAGGTNTIEPGARVYLGVGDNITRHNLHARLRGAGYTFPALVSPHAIVSPGATVDEGAVVFHRAIVQTGARVEAGAVINTGAIVEHDCVVGAYAQLAPAVALSGNVRVGTGTLLGTGCSVNKNVTIGEWGLIAPGLAVLGDVPRYCVYKPGTESLRVETNYRLDEILPAPFPASAGEHPHSAPTDPACDGQTDSPTARAERAQATS